MSPLHKVFESAESFAQHMHDLHKTICDQLNATNLKYKNLADKHRCVQNFEIGDYVMVRLSPERFPSGASQKLQAHSAGPFEILSRVRSKHMWLIFPPTGALAQRSMLRI